MSQTIQWGILGTGAIAKTFARALGHAKAGTLAAVGSRSQESADKFAQEFSIPAGHRHPTYDALLADPTVQAVYISAPHPLHAEWVIKAARAKKHVLVEKPFAINHAQAMAMTEAAIANDIFLMEAFMYRSHPQTAKVVDLLRAKAIGDVRVIQATFSFQAGFNADSRLYSNALAGGGILDVGCYTASIARLIAGAALGQNFADPLDVKAVAHFGSTGIDEWAIASCKFPAGILAQLATGVGVNQDNVVRIYGSDGRIVLPNPWQANRSNPEPGKILLHRKNEKESEEISVPATATSFTYEADAFATAVLAGKRQADFPAMSWDDSLGNIRTLDAWRKDAGLTYEFERLDHYPKLTVSGAPLTKDPASSMTYGQIPGLNKPVSHLLMGCDNQRELSHAVTMFDDFFARGGNAFDTSFIYGGGIMERMLGEWMQLRGVREQCAVMVKGLHSPDTYPQRLAFELPTSLDRLRTSYADAYIMHRDNPAVPVGEFVSVINDHIKAGRIRAWGGSNWTIARLEEARQYAQKNNLVPPTILSNNFSLARMVNPPWAGCLTAGDAETRAYLTKTQIPLLAWSSQARGFFLPGRAAPDKLDDKELARCWYSDDNFQRLERVNQLARQKNVLPINIALAYVLQQPFPTFALIGPRLLSESRTSLAALDVTLTQAELKWLNLEAA